MISVTLHYCMSLIGNARNVMSYSCTGNVSNLYRNVAMLYHCFECLPLAAITDRSSIKRERERESIYITTSHCVGC